VGEAPQRCGMPPVAKWGTKQASEMHANEGGPLISPRLISVSSIRRGIFSPGFANFY
jgi:hypothetical protein